MKAYKSTTFEAYFDFNDLKTPVEVYEKMKKVAGDFLSKRTETETFEEYDCPACVSFRYTSPSRKRRDRLVRIMNRINAQIPLL